MKNNKVLPDYLSDEYADAIAIIGLAGRFPGADSPEEFWANLQAGKESIRYFSEEELRESHVSVDLIRNPSYVRSAPVLNNIALFDAKFFQYSPKEAEAMDPQQRFFLQCSWEAFENAGYNPQDLPGAVGIFAGAGGSITSYLLEYFLKHPEIQGESASIYHFGNDKDYLPMRLAWFLNTKGPAINIQTACSTAIVAIHYACQSIRNGECDMALAGVSNIRVPHYKGYLFKEGGLYSRDGHSRVFDEQSGTVYGSGVGMVVLKSLANAIHDRDHIHAIINSSAVNNDGGDKLSFAALSMKGQRNCCQEAIELSNINPETIEYVEVFGAGTPIGDQSEILALSQAFGHFTKKKNYCAVGSIKPNVGHLEAASGMASLTRIIYSMKNQCIPALINTKKISGSINFKDSPFYLVSHNKPWPTNDNHPRRALLNSIGIGGTNAVLVIEEAPKQAEFIEQAPHPQPVPTILALSAKSEKALKELIASYTKFVSDNPDINIDDLCFTACVGRQHFNWRTYCLVKNTFQLLSGLENTFLHESTRVTKGGILFSETTALDPTFLTNIYLTYSVFAKDFDKCLEVFNKIFNKKYDFESTVIFLSKADKNELSKKIYQFSSQYALCSLFEFFGIEFDFLSGLGRGRCIAAAILELLPLENAIGFYCANENDVLVDIHPLIKKSFAADELKKIYICDQTGLPNHFQDTSQYWSASNPSENGDNLKRYFEKNHIQSLLCFNEKFFLQGCELQLVSIVTEESLLKLMGQLYTSGWKIKWQALYKPFRCERIPLPLYPFQGERFWIQHTENDVLFEPNTVKKTLASTTRLQRTANVDEVKRIIDHVVAITVDLHNLSLDDYNKKFAELGIDSLLLVEFSEKLSNYLPVDVMVHTADIASCSSLTTLQSYIYEKINEKNKLESNAIPWIEKTKNLFKQTSEETLQNRFDASKFWLMFFVITFHFLRPAHQAPFIINNSFFAALNYFSGYFAIPAFVMISGVYAKKSLSHGYVRSLIKNIIFPYIILNIVGNILHYEHGVFLLDPYMATWFLLTYAMWMVTFPIVSGIRYLFILSLFVTLVVGMTDAIGLMLSASRYFYYFPFFIFGFFWGKKILERVPKPF